MAVSGARQHTTWLGAAAAALAAWHWGVELPQSMLIGFAVGKKSVFESGVSSGASCLLLFAFYTQG